MTQGSFATRLKDCRAVVTGGAQGIGAAIARRLVEEGAHVVICDRDDAAGAPLAREIGGRFAKVDVTDAEAVRRFAAESGGMDILVNNAGGDQHAFFTQTGLDDWRRLLAINLESAFAFTLAFLPAMQAACYGRIVNISSEAGRLGSKGGAVYAAAKGGLIAFSKSIARENARFGVTSNVVAPGPISTRMLARAIETSGEKLIDGMKNATLLRRLGEPEEVAAAVAFLASREASYITGETLGVSGGMGLG
jgi:2-hydroxycyclohexanecarboxyl-CoA dehydrogenase